MAEEFEVLARVNTETGDSRVTVSPVTSPPYNWICTLDIIVDLNDRTAQSGTGFKINLPRANFTAVVTCGHCVYPTNQRTKTRGFPDKIFVTFPGESPLIVTEKDLFVSPEYKRTPIPEFDYGLILLPGDSSEGFGWSAQLSDEELKNRIVTVCGYDTPHNTGRDLRISGGPLVNVSPREVEYFIDTSGGVSGAPVYTWSRGFWTVVAIHTTGCCPNIGTRFIVGVMSEFIKRLTSVVFLESVFFRNVVVNCDCGDLRGFRRAGGGQIVSQHRSGSSSQFFFLVPLEYPPSLAEKPQLFKVAIECAQASFRFMRMDGRSVRFFLPLGGGFVNCQVGVQPWEIFYQRIEDPENNIFSFISVAFENCRLRVDGSRVLLGANGVVNCQWYEDRFVPARGFERIQVVNVS